jgi:hypothetical protein
VIFSPGRGMVAKKGLLMLTATELMHEAWLRVSKDDEPRRENRRHFHTFFVVVKNGFCAL